MKSFPSKRRALLICLLANLCAGCHKPAPKNNEIIKVEFAYEWPAGAVSVDSSLTYNYFGGEHAQRQGYFKGKITRSFWDTLNRKFEKVHYKQLDTVENIRVDAIGAEFIVYWKGGYKRHIRTELGRLPDSVANVIYWLANSFKRVKLHPAKDTIPFETAMQRPLPIPLIPKGFRVLPPNALTLGAAPRLIGTIWTHKIAEGCVNTLKLQLGMKAIEYDCEMNYTFKGLYSQCKDTLIVTVEDDSHSEDGGKSEYYKSKYLIRKNALYMLGSRKLTNGKWKYDRVEVNKSIWYKRLP